MGFAVAVAVAVAGTGLASAALPPKLPRQQVLVSQACDATSTVVQRAVLHAAETQAQVITSHIRVTGPGRLTGKIAFNPTGSTISVAADTSAKRAATGFGCAEGAVGPGVPKRHGHTVLVSTLHRTFAGAGRYTLTFTLNTAAERILTRLGAADRAYRKRHPHGSRPPSIAFGVSLSYAPAG